MRIAIDAVEIELLFGISVLALQAVGRIGEIHVAIALEDDVIGAVEALAHVAIDQRHFPAAFHARDTAVAVLAEDQPALKVAGQAVGAGLAAAGSGAGVAGGL